MRAWIVILCMAVAACHASPEPARLTVSVAASLGDVMGDLAARYQSAHGTVVGLNTGGSNAMARQIANGAPVDLFISADEAQMDVVERAGRTLAGSRVTLCSNQLVLITPRDARVVVKGPADLNGPDVRRIALAHPDSVPAGVYAKQWLDKHDLWTSIQPKVIPLPTVRAALAAVREGRAEAGIVYVTDARTTSDVAVAYVVPLDEAPRITYPAAAITGERQEAAVRFLKFLQSDEARGVFDAAGFILTSR